VVTFVQQGLTTVIAPAAIRQPRFGWVACHLSTDCRLPQNVRCPKNRQCEILMWPTALMLGSALRWKRARPWPWEKT